MGKDRETGAVRSQRPPAHGAQALARGPSPGGAPQGVAAPLASITTRTDGRSIEPTASRRAGMNEPLTPEEQDLVGW